MIYDTEVVGKRIKEERLKLGLTQAELGGKVGVVGKQISIYENKPDHIPPLDVLLKMCGVFNCELGYLLGEQQYTDGTRLETEIISSTGLTKESLANIRLITGASDECIGLECEFNDYKRILNRLLSSNGLFSIMDTLSTLDTCYSIFANETKEETLNRALEIYTGSKDLEQLTDEEANFYRLADKLISKKETLDFSVKVYRYELWEGFSRLLDEMYPKK